MFPIMDKILFTIIYFLPMCNCLFYDLYTIPHDGKIQLATSNYGYFSQSNLINCSFEEPNLCSWTVDPKGPQWIATNSTLRVPQPPQNDSFLTIDYDINSNFIENSQVYSPVFTNNESYVEIAFRYYINPSKLSSVTQLKVALSQHDYFRWLFDSDDFMTDKWNNIWHQESFCTYVDYKKGTTQFVFHGTVGRGSEIAIDDVTISPCLRSVDVDCTFEKDICGWQMQSGNFTSWKREKDSTDIPNRHQGEYYLRFDDQGNISHAHLLSQAVVAASSLTLHFWYYTNGNISTVSLNIAIQKNKKTRVFPANISEVLLDAEWHHTSVFIEDIEDRSQLVIDAMVGPGYCLAIDDIEVKFGDECADHENCGIDPQTKQQNCNNVVSPIKIVVCSCLVMVLLLL